MYSNAKTTKISCRERVVGTKMNWWVLLILSMVVPLGDSMLVAATPFGINLF